MSSKKSQLDLQITSQFFEHIKWEYNNKLSVQLSKFLFTIGAWKLAQTDFWWIPDFPLKLP